ncbi:hypothetical protein P8631_02105 [Guyparkeria sp. 1SP6A2]|nr:hypothetical protein [Guyparkeria sp. 1SP6A2]
MSVASQSVSGVERIQDGSLPADWEEAGLAAWDEWVGIQQALASDNQTVLTELFRDHRDDGFDYWAHFPADDAQDAHSGARFYYHAHDPAEWTDEEHGHFHLFIPREGEPNFAHVVALSMTAQGALSRVFTTNAWVTGESMLPADRLLERLPGAFEINRARPSWLVGRWLTAAVALLMPVIAPLLKARDEQLLDPGGAWPSPAVSTDRDRHILSEQVVDMPTLIAAWSQRAAALTE